MQSWASRSLAEALHRLKETAEEGLIADLARIADLVEAHFDAVFWHPETEDVLSDLSLASAMEEVAELARTIRRLFALQHVAATVVAEAPGAVFARRMLTTFPAGWIKEYVRGQYRLQDPIFAIPEDGGSAFLEQLSGTAPVYADFLERARRAGIGPAGIVHWHEVSPGTVVAVMITSQQDVAGFRRTVGRIGLDLEAMTLELARAFARANGLPQLDPAVLTDNELTLLRSVMRGIADGTVRPLDQNLNENQAGGQSLLHRLGLRSLSQAATAAASTGILCQAPLGLEDFWDADGPLRMRDPEDASERPRKEAEALFRYAEPRAEPFDRTGMPSSPSGNSIETPVEVRPASAPAVDQESPDALPQRAPLSGAGSGAAGVGTRSVGVAMTGA